MNESEIAFFDRLAPDWDANEVRSTPERVKSILSRLSIGEGMEVLDLGTGTGVLVPQLSRLVGPEGRVVGVDLSEGMLDIARRKHGHLENVEFLRLDFEEEQLPGRYDIVMLFCVYPHLHYPQETLEWLFRFNVKEGGKVVIGFSSDEEFVNNIHGHRKAESDCLPPAAVLAGRIASWGYDTQVLAATRDEYIVTVTAPNP